MFSDSPLSKKPFVSTFSETPTTEGSLDNVLVNNQLSAAVYLPLLNQGTNRAVMVFASAGQTYLQEHVDFLSNIAATISHVLEKTVVTENLVTSAVQGHGYTCREPRPGNW